MANVMQRARQAVKVAVGIMSGGVSPSMLDMMTGISAGGGIGYPPKRGVKGTLDGYSTMPWLRAVSEKIAHGVASVEWKLYATGKQDKPATRSASLQRASFAQRKAMIRQKQREGDLREIETHPLLTLLDNANGYHTGVGLRKLTQNYLDLVGEAFWIKERSVEGVTSGMPVGLWPVPPHWVINTPTPKERRYRISYSGWNVEIPDTEILWFCNLDPSNPYGRGTGTAMALGDELETDEYAAKYTKNFFYNSAKPDFLVFPKSPATLTEPNVKRLEDDWNAKNRGFWKPFKAHFLAKEVGIHEFGGQGDMRALQMSELRKSERDTIIQVFGVSPESIGIVAGADRAHAEAARHMLTSECIVPRLEFLRATMQERLIPEFDERLILDYESPVEEDREFLLKASAAAPYTLTVDEWRDLQGEGPKEDGSGTVHMVPFNLTPMETIAVPEPVVIPPVPPVPPVAPVPPKAIQGNTSVTRFQDAEWHKALTADARTFHDAKDYEHELSVTRELRSVPENLPDLAQIAARMEPRLRRIFLEIIKNSQASIDLDALASAIRDQNLPAIEEAARLTTLNARMQAELLQPIRTAYLAGAEFAHAVLADSGISMSFDLVNPLAVRWAQTAGSGRITVITESTRDAIRSLVAQAFTEGRDADKTARLIKHLNGFGLNEPQLNALENFQLRLEADGTIANDIVERRVARYGEALLRQRSQMVARTEMMTASSEGQRGLWDQAKASGMLREEQTRQWIVADDDRLCQDCEAYDGAEATLDGEYKQKAGGTGKYPTAKGPTLHPNCRCAEGLVRPR